MSTNAPPLQRVLLIHNRYRAAGGEERVVEEIATLLAERGRVADGDLEQVFNLGVGMVAIVAPADSDRALRLLADRGVPSWALGEIVAGTGNARLVSQHPA